MKKLLSFIAAILFAAISFAKDGEIKDVTLVTNGSGKTKQEAVNYALRSALEQTFGTFVSTNTSIVNDKLTKDEIVSISTGNIKNYKELSSATLPTGQFAVVVQSTISLSKLTTYAKSHGSSCELAGATFAQNMKLRELNKQNEIKVINNLKRQLKEIEKNLFDVSITAETPRKSNENYAIPITLNIKGCENTDACMNLILSTFKNISLSSSEREDYEKTGEKYWPLEFKCTSNDPSLQEILMSSSNRTASAYYSGQTMVTGVMTTYYVRNNLKYFPPMDFNRMLKEIKICVHGKNNLNYKLEIDERRVQVRTFLYEKNGKKLNTSSNNQYASKWRDANPNSRSYVKVGRLPYTEADGICKPDAYYAPGNGKKKKKNVNYNTITNINLELIVPKEEMEYISNIELIVP